MLVKRDRNALRQRRHLRIRRVVRGTLSRPRLSVYRSEKHLYAQVIDDATGRTLAAASSLDPAIRQRTDASPIEVARAVGEMIAERARAAGIVRVVFDRGGYQYHGRVRSLAEGARGTAESPGLEF